MEAKVLLPLARGTKKGGDDGIDSIRGKKECKSFSK
jgi:hypothetical protein